MTTDHHYMRSVLSLARQGLGKTWPNPSVGCVIVKNGSVIARARTADGGRPHAEKLALAKALEDVRGASAYVTLEPCFHEREGGSCAQALINSGVSRALVACTDPDQRTAGRGIAAMRAAGLEVVAGVFEGEARELNKGFFLARELGRPLFTLKTATTLDGKIATKTQESQWITGALARRRGHLERSCHDAILTGIGTVQADDPELTCRLTGVHRQPVRIVIDTNLSISHRSRILETVHKGPVWIVCANGQAVEKQKQLIDRSVDIIEVNLDKSGQCDLKELSAILAKRGLTRVLIEAGMRLNGAFLRSGLVDRLLWFRAASILGDDAYASVPGLGIERLTDLYSFERREIIPLGPDLLEIYKRQA